MIKTTRRPEIKDLDSLPFPAWDLVDVPRYKRIWRERHGYFSMNMVTTRGCPFHCNWCAKPIWGQRYNVRSPENVVAELEYLHATYQPDLIWFMDDIFGLKPGWLPKYAALLKSEGWQIPFKCLSRVDLLLRPGEVDALKAAGCQIVWVGAESGSQKVLDAMDKGTQVEQIYRLTPLLHQAGLQVGFFIQFGYPGEERDDIEKTLAMLRTCQPDDIGISVSYPLPGTRFYEAVRSQLGERQNWEDSSDLAMLYQGPFSTEFYRQLYGVAHKEFRARKLWKALRGSFGRDHTLSWRIRFHYLERIFFNLASLPLARRKLNRLATHSGSGLRSLPHMLPRAASTPTPQDE